MKKSYILLLSLFFTGLYYTFHKLSIITVSISFGDSIITTNAFYICVLIFIAAIGLYIINRILHDFHKLIKSLFNKTKPTELLISEIIIDIEFRKHSNISSKLIELSSHNNVPEIVLNLLAYKIAILSKDNAMVYASLENIALNKEYRINALKNGINFALEHKEYNKALEYLDILIQVEQSPWTCGMCIKTLLEKQDWTALLELLDSGKCNYALDNQTQSTLYLIATHYKILQMNGEVDNMTCVHVLLEVFNMHGAIFLPLNLLLVELLGEINMLDEMKYVLKESWSYKPHNILIQAALDLYNKMEPHKFFVFINEMVVPHRNKIHSLILMSEAAIQCRNFDNAANHINDILKQGYEAIGHLLRAKLELHTSHNARLALEDVQIALDSMHHCSFDKEPICYYWNANSAIISDKCDGSGLLISSIKNV